MDVAISVVVDSGQCLTVAEDVECLDRKAIDTCGIAEIARGNTQ